MTADQRGEISGYIWKELPGIQARIPMPQSWLCSVLEAFNWGPYLAIAQRTTLWTQFGKDVIAESYLMLPEPPQPGERCFTAMSVALCSKVGGTPADIFIQDFLKNPPPDIMPISDLKVENSGPLVLTKGFFVAPTEDIVRIPEPTGEVRTFQVPPTHFYAMTIRNKAIDAAGIAVFGTPSLMWKDLRRTAETMVDNVMFSQNLALNPTPN